MPKYFFTESEKMHGEWFIKNYKVQFKKGVQLHFANELLHVQKKLKFFSNFSLTWNRVIACPTSLETACIR